MARTIRTVFTQAAQLGAMPLGSLHGKGSTTRVAFQNLAWSLEARVKAQGQGSLDLRLSRGEVLILELAGMTETGAK